MRPRSLNRAAVHNSFTYRFVTWHDMPLGCGRTYTRLKCSLDLFTSTDRKFFLVSGTTGSLAGMTTAPGFPGGRRLPRSVARLQNDGKARRNFRVGHLPTHALRSDFSCVTCSNDNNNRLGFGNENKLRSSLSRPAGILKLCNLRKHTVAHRGRWSRKTKPHNSLRNISLLSRSVQVLETN